MMMLVIVAALIGALLSQRFNVFVLAPAIVIASTSILTFGIAQNANFWSILLAGAITIAALQFGYLGGMIIRYVISGGRQGSPDTIAAAQRSIP